MKIKQLITGSLLGVALLTLVQSASAITLNIGDIYSIGLVYKGTPANAASVMGYINNLTPLAANSSTVIGGNTYTRSANTFSGHQGDMCGRKKTAARKALPFIEGEKNYFLKRRETRLKPDNAAPSIKTVLPASGTEAEEPLPLNVYTVERPPPLAAGAGF